MEMRSTCQNMYRLGWDERNGGNISYMLDENEVTEYLDTNNILRTIPLGFDATALVGKIFIVTGTGKYFKYLTCFWIGRRFTCMLIWFTSIILRK